MEIYYNAADRIVFMTRTRAAREMVAKCDAYAPLNEAAAAAEFGEHWNDIRYRCERVAYSHEERSAHADSGVTVTAVPAEAGLDPDSLLPAGRRHLPAAVRTEYGRNVFREAAVSFMRSTWGRLLKKPNYEGE